MNNGEELLAFVIKAHGGLKRWKDLKEVKIHANIGGLTWANRGHPDVLSDVHFHGLLHHQYAIYYPFISKNQRSIFEAERVAIETLDGQLISALQHPRASILSQPREMKWSELQLVYFPSYAMWNYLTMPFNFTLPGILLKEIEPWQEGNETWRRLEVTFPDYIATHSKKQVFYYGEDGLLRRQDYRVEIFGGLPGAHFTYDYKEFSGIMIPTKRRVYGRNEDNSFNPTPVFIEIDINEVEFK